MFKLSRSLLLLFLALVFLLSSCDIIDTIIGGDEDSINIDDNYTLIGSQSIGSMGGEINLDSIIVEIQVEHLIVIVI